MIQMPAPDPRTLARRAEIAAALRAIVPDGTIADEATLTAYDRDALTAYQPAAAGLRAARERRSGVGGAGLCRAGEHPHRAAGRGDVVVGGALPLADGILLGLSRMSRILDVDFENRCAVVQPGVTNASVTRAVQGQGLLLRPRSFEPDRLHHRGQCRGEFRRHPLSEIRADDAEPDGRRAGADEWRAAAARRQACGRWRAGSVERGLRLGRVAGRGHGSDVADSAAPARDPHLADRVRHGAGGGRDGGRDHRRRHHSGRARIHGPALHRDRGGVLRARLSGRMPKPS